MTTYPAPTRAQRRAWALKKQDDRARAAYRNSLPQGIRRLEALLASAESPWHAEVIQARIAQVREQTRYKIERRRSRTPEQIARDQADVFPDGHQVCAGCGRRLPVSDFPRDLGRRSATARHCHDCRAEHLAAQAERENDARINNR
ncbi:hypothetical protein MZK47_07270 [Microbacterium aerolatum]|uniref:hypothetical protein n=1 Tax=Microbacterium aerolatum TaxID=153731 RepID=UPI0020016EAC|nr:hypothetical protein [Microbacterium aerolatum]MCK3769464.1 hypothetical protein [Microbacterium aerolatum]